jgi:hypothetical protein
MGGIWSRPGQTASAKVQAEENARDAARSGGRIRGHGLRFVTCLDRAHAHDHAEEIEALARRRRVGKSRIAEKC